MIAIERTPNRRLPPLRELGLDLLRISRRQRLLTLVLPFICCGAYFGFTVVG